MIEHIYIDFETYSEVDIKTVGAWAYAAHPSTEFICMAYTPDSCSTVEVTANVDKCRQRLEKWLSDTRFQLHAWNAFFEMSIAYHVLKVNGALSPARWTDPAAQAAAMALPRSLGACGVALNMPQDEQKDKRGRYLIQRLCKPYRGERVRDPALLIEFYQYCRQDVSAMRAISSKLRPLSAIERRVWELDQAINIRGVPIDTQTVDDAIAITNAITSKLDAKVKAITTGALENTRQRQKVIDYIERRSGYVLESFDKAYLTSVLHDEKLPPLARYLIEIRLQTGKTSTAKYHALQALVTDDNRAHGLLMYHAASTGRWGGRHFQPQNLPRGSFSDTDTCIELFKYRDIELLEAIYDDPMEALSSCLRGVICASVGKRLIVCDYNAIEARVLAWLAGQEDVLEVFRGHGRIYEHTASRIYHVGIEQVTKAQRFVGKTATLALGYQGGVKAFQAMAKAYGEDISEDLAEQIKNDWRKANPRIVSFWYDTDKVAVNAVKHPGERFICRGIGFRVIGGFLYCRLPSGRLLAYCQPQLVKGDFGGQQVSYMGTNSVTRKWERQKTYGGRLVENITQAVARDLLAEAMLRVEKAGYPVVLSVHDEIITETRSDFGSISEFESLMCELPSWAQGLPVKAEGFTCKRYHK